MKTEIEHEYVVSPRVALRPGDQFRVGAGPYYRTADGEKLPMAVRGVVTFRRVLRRGRLVLVEAQAGEGTVILHTEGRRRSPVEGMVPRPYKIRGKVRGTKKSRKAV